MDRDRAKCPDNVLIDCPAFAQTLSAGGGGEEMEQFGSARHRAEDCARNSVLRRVLATGGRWRVGQGQEMPEQGPRLQLKEQKQGML